MSTPRWMLRTMVFALAGMVLVFWGIGLLLAGEWRVDTVRQVAASPARLAAVLSDLSTWTQWSSMQADLGPQTTMEVTGAPGTVGQAITWSGSRGKAMLRLSAVAADSIEYQMLGQVHQSQAVPGQAVAGMPVVPFAKGRIGWLADGGNCRVHWHEERQCESLVERWFVWFGAVQERVRQIQAGSLTGLAQMLEGTDGTVPK